LENKEVLKTLLDIYLFSDIDNEEALDNYLKENDIDSENLCLKTEDMVRHKRAELQIEKGRKFRSDYIKLLAYLSLSPSKLEIDIIKDKSPALAYRKKTDGDVKPDDLEAKKLEMIRKAKGTK
jgi:hypothetical protein